MTKRKCLKLSEEEKKLLVTELAGRIRDLVYIRLDDQIERKLNDILPDVQSDESCDSRFSFDYSFEMSFGDIFQIIGRKRRTEK